MPGYLEGYGAGEEQREKLLKRIALFVGLALIVGGPGPVLLPAKLPGDATDQAFL